MKKLNLILLIMGMATGVWAERVDLSTARRVAEQVAFQSALRSAGGSTLKLAYEAPALSGNGLRSTTGEIDYYVFNAGEEDGFDPNGGQAIEVGDEPDDPGTLADSVEMVETPLSWDMTLSNENEDPETGRLVSYDATFTLLRADTALMDRSETELFAYFTLDEGVSATITDGDGMSHDLIDEGNGRYRLDDWRVRLAEDLSPLTLHVELTGNEAGMVILPSLERACHDGKLISVNTYAVDISYSDFDENYFSTVDPDSVISIDNDAELSLSSLAPIDRAIFKLVPVDSAEWLASDQLVSLDEDGQEKSLEWDATTRSFIVGPDAYRMAYDEFGWVEYTLPLRLKATQEGRYGFALEVWDTRENVRVKRFDDQEIRVTYPVRIGQLRIPQGYVGTTDTLAFYLKNDGELLKDSSFTLALQLDGNLPDKSVTLFDGADSIPFTARGERAIEVRLDGRFDADSLGYEYRIRSSVPVQGGVYNPFVVYLLDEKERRIPVDEHYRLDVYFYEDYKFEIDLDSAIVIESSSEPITAPQDTITVRSGATFSLSMGVAEGYRLPSVPLLYEDSTLVNLLGSDNYDYVLDDGLATLMIANPKADYRLVMRAVREETQCEVVSADPSIVISDPILDKIDAVQVFNIKAAEGEELPEYVEVTAWRLGPAPALRSATDLGDDTRWEEIEMVYTRDYSYDPETGAVRVRVKDADRIVITPSETEPAKPEEPAPDPEDPVYYTVTLPQTEGATTEPDFGTHEVMAGDSFTFRIILDEDYDESTPVVRVDGELLEPNARGEYVVAVVGADLVITIEGIVRNDDTAIGPVEADAIRVWAADGSLHLWLPRPLPVRVVDYAGRVIRSWQAVEGDQAVALPDGAYVVIVGDTRFKVVL